MFIHLWVEYIYAYDVWCMRSTHANRIFLRVSACGHLYDGGLENNLYGNIENRVTHSRNMAISSVCRAKSLNSNISAQRYLFVLIKVHGVPTNCMRFFASFISLPR